MNLNKVFATFFTALSVFALGAVPALAAVNPMTGDDFNLPLMLGIAGGALVLIIITLMLTKKKK